MFPMIVRKGGVIAAIVLVSLLTAGCSLKVTKAGASGEINAGFATASWYVEVEEDEDEEDSNALLGLIENSRRQVSLSTAVAEVDLSVYGDNASIPDQSVSAVLKVVHGGTLHGAQSFSGYIQNGIVSLNNPGAVENWLSQYDHLGSARVEVETDVDMELPDSGSFSLTNVSHYAGSILASNTTSGYVDPGGDPDPPVIIE